MQRRKLAGLTISIQNRRDGKYAARVVIHNGAKRTTRNFKTLEEAKAFAQRQEIEAMNAGARAAAEIGDNERRVLLHAREALAVYGKTLADAVAFYLKHLETAARSSPVSKVIDSLLAHKKTEGKSARYLADLRSRLGIFAREYGDRPIAELTAEEISQWLARLNLSPTTTNNTRRVLAVLWNFAADRGLCAPGVMRKTIRLKASEKEPGILTVAEAEALLKASAPEVRAAVALGLFCGIRDDELRRMDWSMIDWENRCVVIGAKISKVNQRRIIPLRPNALAWLLPLRQPGGRILANGKATMEKIQRARNAAGFGTPSACERDATLKPWPANALRHSYASYRLAMWPDAAALALEMGNSPAVILRHYRQLVTPAAAKAYWSLTPAKAEGENIVNIKSA